MLVAIEGIDAAGKGTQAGLLRGAAARAGVSAAVVSFPRYGETVFAASVGTYLNGGFGGLSQVPPEFAALLYAGDRFESRGAVERLLEAHELVICDRYVASNLAYQGARVGTGEREGFFAWLATIEHEVYGLPRAELTFFLDVPVAAAAALLLRKGERAYTAERADLHERDRSYLAAVREVYMDLAARGYGGAWQVVPGVEEDGSLRAPEEVHAELWEGVHARLAAGRRAI